MRWPGISTWRKYADTSKLVWVLAFPLIFVVVMLMLAIADWLGRRTEEPANSRAAEAVAKRPYRCPPVRVC